MNVVPYTIRHVQAYTHARQRSSVHAKSNKKLLFSFECWTFFDAHRLASIWLQIIANIILYYEGSSWSGGILKEDTYLRNGCDQLLG